jgi:hypothetical protein
LAGRTPAATLSVAVPLADNVAVPSVVVVLSETRLMDTLPVFTVPAELLTPTVREKVGDGVLL